MNDLPASHPLWAEMIEEGDGIRKFIDKTAEKLRPHDFCAVAVHHLDLNSYFQDCYVQALRAKVADYEDDHEAMLLRWVGDIGTEFHGRYGVLIP